MSLEDARKKYAALGVDIDKAIVKLKTVPVALHCWQGDDVRGFDRGHSDHRELPRAGPEPPGADGGYRPGGRFGARPDEAEPARQLRHF